MLFVEGEDVAILARLAASLGLSAANPGLYATVPMGGFSRNAVASGFAEVLGILGGGVASIVILDSDLNSAESLASDLAEVRKFASHVHVWRRRELENYLLDEAAIAACSGLSTAEAGQMLSCLLDDARDEARRAFVSARLEEADRKKTFRKSHSSFTIVSDAERDFDALWSQPLGPEALVDAKAVIAKINAEIALRKKRSISAVKLAVHMQADRIDPEVRSVLEELSSNIIGFDV